MNDYLQIKEITKRYGEKIAVDRLNLSVPSGCIYGIIGPNGAGKTTTIRMIMNIIIPDSGEIFINGQAASGKSQDRIGYLPEERGLYKKMTLREIVLYLGQLKNVHRKDILNNMDAWFERMNLLDYKDKNIEELSKGMQQKLQFITTLIHEPELIILDELFSGLDPLNIELIKNILLELKKDGRTILFSTHVMEQAEKLCDYICMINAGQKVLDGSINEIKRSYGKNNIHLDIEGDGGFLENLEGIEKITKFNKYFELNLKSNADSNKILKSISDRATVNRFEKVEPSLYNIFIDKAGHVKLSETESSSEGRIGHE
ncbi:MAG: ATP-binding cassette domain-containing protein [candidate division Zixibacteria bacterium]